MTSRDFAFWLQGWFEIQNPKSASGEVLDMIKAHLNLVFKHEIDPSIDKHHTLEEITELNEIHNKPTLQEYGWYKKSEGILRC